MVKAALVESDIEEGKRLIAALDESGFIVVAALWTYLSEPEEWRLMIASPVVSKHGPKEAYTRVQSLIGRTTPPLSLSLNNISLVGPQDEVVQTLSSIIHTGPIISSIRLSGNTVNGYLIEDVYIYRLNLK